MRLRLANCLGLMIALGALSLVPVKAQQPAAGAAPLPPKFDLRAVGGVTPIKQQLGGTCWTHGTMASIESNLLMSGVWRGSGLPGTPAVSEYHLDWWNGFNKHCNTDLADDDPAKAKSLTVHVGGDYRVSAAYFNRGEGPVLLPAANNAYQDKAWHKSAPPRNDASQRRFYVRDIEWFTIGDNLEGIDVIKRRLMTEGAVATAYSVGKGFLSKDFVHYQPADSKAKPNHAVAIVGWDDAKVGEGQKPPRPGAWLIKNSWGTKRGDNGYYWISYYDKVCCRDPEMGAVSFRNLEPMCYTHIYYHDYHGWRDTLTTIPRAFNAFTATGKQQLRAVSFYTSKDNARYTAKVYGRFENGTLSKEMASQSGSFRHTGYHTVNLDAPLWLEEGQKFYVYVELSEGGHAIDRTSVIPVLLGQQKGKERPLPLVASKASAGESYYNDGTGWKDLYEYTFKEESWNRTANFCIKALAVAAPSSVQPLPPPAAETRKDEPKKDEGKKVEEKR